MSAADPVMPSSAVHALRDAAHRHRVLATPLVDPGLLLDDPGNGDGVVAQVPARQGVRLGRLLRQPDQPPGVGELLVDPRHLGRSASVWPAGLCGPREELDGLAVCVLRDRALAGQHRVEVRLVVAARMEEVQRQHLALALRRRRGPFDRSAHVVVQDRAAPEGQPLVGDVPQQPAAEPDGAVGRRAPGSPPTASIAPAGTRTACSSSNPSSAASSTIIPSTAA